MILDCPAGNLIPISWVFLPWISDCCQLHAVGQAFSVLAWKDVRNQLGQSRQEQIHGIYRSVSKSAIQLLPANVVGWIHAQKAHTLEGTQNILAKKMQSDNGIRKECMCPKIFKGNVISCQQHEHLARCHPGHAKLGTALNVSNLVIRCLLA